MRISDCSSDVCSSDLATIKLLLAARAGIDPARMGERRYIRFKASDGMELAGYLTLPAGVQSPDKPPLVLMHPGGPHVDGNRWGVDHDAQFHDSRAYLTDRKREVSGKREELRRS